METLKAAAEAVLSETFGGPVRLGQSQAQGGSDRSKVLRFRVEDGPTGGLESVIVKHAPGDESKPYDPDDGASMAPAWRLFNDWAGAQFLSGLPVLSGLSGGASLCPKFLGGDRAGGLIVLEDIDEGDSLADVLLGNDAARADAALLAFARVLGRMHAASAGQFDAFAHLRQSLGPFVADLSPMADDARGGLTAMAAAGVKRTAGADSDMEDVVRAVTEPGPFLCYTHGDPCPDNNRLHNGEMKLFDWEFGQFRHALLDGVYARVPFPTCWCVNRLPPDLPPRMEAAYRAELVSGVPEAGEDAVFSRAVAAACAFWLLRTTRWSLEKALTEDGEWGISTHRQRLLVRADTFAALSDETRQFPALGALARDLAARLRAEWPPDADAMPLYPAFRA